MRSSILKTGAAAALAGVLAVASTTPSFARHWGRTAAAAGIGFAAGAVLGATVANRGYYYGPTYAYDPYYDGNGYVYGGPVYAYEGPAYGYSGRWSSRTRLEAQMDRSQQANPGH